MPVVTTNRVGQDTRCSGSSSAGTLATNPPTIPVTIPPLIIALVQSLDGREADWNSTLEVSKSDRTINRIV